jgi:hypothetical protein
VFPVVLESGMTDHEVVGSRPASRNATHHSPSSHPEGGFTLSPVRRRLCHKLATNKEHGHSHDEERSGVVSRSIGEEAGLVPGRTL